MQTPAPQLRDVRRRADLLSLAAAACDAGVPLLAPATRTAAAPEPVLPLLPTEWVERSRIATAAERYTTYTRGAVELHLHTMLGWGEHTPQRQIAQLNLGAFRVRVSAGTTWRGFEACWSDGTARHRLVCRAPLRLADFLDLLLTLHWE
ncbi:hypothetical protein Cs7R123_61060 [Catellatospora sp. TT07R-123]|uniref:hypothetical protein n=1 Tax=Catellatospora sp. TT07R-123 TaxID=2733863 RepID=UPI001B2A7565|nr:hypothetical protein [Catellatospora sp. TT07R-123]GHJ48764.1 hypothetical protein Cs7R123_61060 [Catellatospora sp. TT07R-123]